MTAPTPEQMAKLCELSMYDGPRVVGYEKDVKIIAAAIREAEATTWRAAIEAAAGVCDKIADEARVAYYAHADDALIQKFCGGEEVGADDCSEAIRALTPPNTVSAAQIDDER